MTSDGGGLFSLGKAYVTVSPDTEGFKEKLNAALEKDKTEVKVKVVPDASDFKTRLDAALAKSRSDKTTVKVTADTKDYTAKLDAALKRPRSTTVTVKYDKSQLSAAGADAGGLFSKAFAGGVSGAGGSAAASAGGSGGIGGGFGGVATGVGIAGAVTAALSVLPAAMTAIGSAAGVGLGVAITSMAMSRINTLKTSIASLQSQLGSDKKGSTAYKQDATQLASEQAQLKQLAAFEQIDKQITKLGTDAETALFTGVRPFLSYFSAGLSSISGWLPQLTKQLSSFFSAVGPSVMPLVQDLEYLVSTILPAFTGLLKNNQDAVTEFYSGIGVLIHGIGDFLHNIGPGVQASMDIFVSLMENLSAILADVGNEAANAANEFGGPIINAITGLSDLLQTLLHWFVQLGGAVMPLIGVLGEAFSSLLNSAMPLIMPLISQLVGYIDRIVVMLTPFLVQLLQGLRPVVPIAQQLLSAFMSMAVVILEDLMTALRPLIPVLSQILVTLLKPMEAILKMGLAPDLRMFGVLVSALSPVLFQLATALLRILTGLQPIILVLVKLESILLNFAAMIVTKVIQYALAPFVLWIAKLIDWIAEGIQWFGKWTTAGHNWQKAWSATVNWLHSSWSSMVNAVHVAWSNMINFITGTWDRIGSDTKGAWNSITNWLRNSWNGIINFFHNIWNGARNWLKGVWNGFGNDAKAAWNSIHSWFTGFWRNEVNGWKNIINSVRNWMKGAWNGIKNDAVAAFRALSSGVSSAFRGIENGVKVPINWVLSTVDKFDGLINHIPGVHLPTNLKLAGGGVIPGYAPGRDTVPAMLSPGEGVLVPEAVKAMGPDNIRAINAAYSSRPPGDGTGYYAGGGIIPGWLSTAWNTITDPVKWVADKIGNLVSGIPGSGIGLDVAKGAANAIVSAVKSYVNKAFEASTVHYNASAGVKQWLPDVLKALALNHLPSSLANQVLKQIATESGGNPNAINNWDSNAAAGDPSRGLLQTIGSTFRAYHVPGTSNNIYDPLANIAAAIAYAKARYGPTLMRGGFGLGSGHGYALGGNPMAGEYAVVGENGPELAYFGKNAHVFTNRQSAGMGGVHFHEGSIVINGKMSNQDVLQLKQQLANAVAGFNF